MNFWRLGNIFGGTPDSDFESIAEMYNIVNPRISAYSDEQSECFDRLMTPLTRASLSFHDITTMENRRRREATSEYVTIADAMEHFAHSSGWCKTIAESLDQKTIDENIRATEEVIKWLETEKEAGIESLSKFREAYGTRDWMWPSTRDYLPVQYDISKINFGEDDEMVKRFLNSYMRSPWGLTPSRKLSEVLPRALQEHAARQIEFSRTYGTIKVPKRIFFND